MAWTKQQNPGSSNRVRVWVHLKVGPRTIFYKIDAYGDDSRPRSRSKQNRVNIAGAVNEAQHPNTSKKNV